MRWILMRMRFIENAHYQYEEGLLDAWKRSSEYEPSDRPPNRCMPYSLRLNHKPVRARSLANRKRPLYNPSNRMWNSVVRMIAVPFRYQPFQARQDPAGLFHAGFRRSVGPQKDIHS